MTQKKTGLFSTFDKIMLGFSPSVQKCWDFLHLGFSPLGFSPGFVISSVCTLLT